MDHAPHHASAAPSLWTLIKSDLRPDRERWHHAARLAIAGMLIIGLQQTLRFEILYPAMTTLLVVTEVKGFSTVTRFVLNFTAATFGSAASVALCALFIQQPFFLLPLMWGYIILIMYFMGSSRYRSTLFMAGYPFIVITYMSFFDKGHAEHIAIIVYQSVITGLACASLVMVFLWPPVPIEALREKLIGSLKRSMELQRRLLQVAEDGVPLDLTKHVPEYYRAKTPEMVALLDQAQTDLSFDDDTRHHLMSLIAFDSRCAACVGMVADAITADVSNATAQAAEALRTLGERIEGIIERLEHPAGEMEPLPTLPQHDNVPEWLMPLCSVAHEAERVAPSVAAFAAVEDKPDFGTETLRNLRDCLPHLFRQPVLKPNVAQLKHSVKAASAIMICALFCIALNWATGIGCVETVMLVVQATFGGTLLIGGLRMVGVVIAYLISIFAVIWIVPVITTIPGLLAMFGVYLFAMGYGMHGSPRVATPALQIMIVLDFALLQFNGPNISLLPVMNFCLAVAMGVFVTFMVYRLWWPVRAVDELKPCLADMLESVAGLMRSAVAAPLPLRLVDAAHLRMDDDVTKYMAAQSNCQMEQHCPPHRCELQLRAVSIVERMCDDLLLTLGAEVADRPVPADAAPTLLACADNLQCVAQGLRSGVDAPAIPYPALAEGAAPWQAALQKRAGDLRDVRLVVAEMDAMPADAPTIMGLA